MSTRASWMKNVLGAAVLCSAACSTGPKQAMTLDILTPKILPGAGAEDALGGVVGVEVPGEEVQR